MFSPWNKNCFDFIPTEFRWVRGRGSDLAMYVAQLKFSCV